MLIAITTILGFLAPFIGDGFKLFTAAGDRAHEIAMFTLRLQAASKEQEWRMETINAQADIAESAATHTQQVSFGVQLLDKAMGTQWPAWVIVPVFWLFGILDWITGIIRPGITVAMVGFYMFYRWTCIMSIQSVITGHNLSTAVTESWNDQDWAILFMVLAFWFGDRTRQKLKQGK